MRWNTEKYEDRPEPAPYDFEAEARERRKVEKEIAATVGIPKRALAAHEQLMTQMRTNPPECLGLDLFTANRLSQPDMRVLQAICDECPLLAACRAYATAARPLAGFWGGKYHRSYIRRQEYVA